jgi:ankyrin repeat protein
MAANSGESGALLVEGRSSPAPPISFPMASLSPSGLPKTPLQQAARDGREDIVRAHLSRLPKYKKEKVLNAKDADGFTALHYAAKFNRFKILQLLVLSGANPEVITTDERLTPLHFAARYVPRIQDRDVEDRERSNEEAEVTTASTSRRAVQLLITYCRVEPNIGDNYGVTPLHVACSRCNLAALEVLINVPGIKLDIPDNNQDTPLHEACLSGDPEIVGKLLTKMKAEGISLYLQNDEKQTPLHIACKEGYPDVVKLILQHGFEERRALVSAVDNEYNTPLHLACEGGSKVVVHLLLLNNADIVAVKSEEITALHITARLGFTDIAKILVEATQDIVEASDASQQTALHRAAQYNQCEMIDFLLDKGADLTALDEDSYTPLLTAAAHGQADALKKLLDRGAPVDDLDKDGKSVVFVAAEEDHTEVLQVLLSNPIGLKLCRTVNSIHNTPLHIAAQMGNLESGRMLLRASVRIDARNELSKTPMHLAAENGHVSLVLLPPPSLLTFAISLKVHFFCAMHTG